MVVGSGNVGQGFLRPFPKSEVDVKLAFSASAPVHKWGDPCDASWPGLTFSPKTSFLALPPAASLGDNHCFPI